MKRKTILHATLCLPFFILFFIQANAQRTRSEKGKLFTYDLRSRSDERTRDNDHDDRQSAYRSYDGSNNNVSSRRKSDWGAADIPLYREIPADYGASDPNNAMAGARRPSARRISNMVIDEPITNFNSRKLSAFVYVWGQFLDHDMTLTPTDTTEYVPIKLPSDEVVFTEEIPFYRSEVRDGTGVHSTREQTNLNTAWIDGSQVYGSDAARAKWLRTFKGGKMKTSARNFLPFNTTTGEQSAPIDPKAPSMSNDGNKTVKTFVAGDIRAAEHPGIAALHTIFVREHNKICDLLKSRGLTDDEEIYQKARKYVGAILQAITYQEFLPAIGIKLNPNKGYDNDVRPDIANTFATAGYRIGHTMVADDLLLFDNNCNEVPPGEFDLVDVFWNPQVLLDVTMEPFLKGFAAHTQYETDTRINSVLRNFLFVSPNNPVRFGIDLGSLNIQRGRDHGLPDYNTVRKFYTGRSARSFDDITSVDSLADSLRKIYRDVDNVDLWVGILAEDHIPGTSVGYTMHEMLRTQFEKLRDGDYYFYLNDPNIPESVLKIITKTKFSDIIKANTSLTNLQSNVFFTEACSEDDEVEAASLNPLTMSAGLDSLVSNVRIYPNPVSNIMNVDLGNITAASRTIKIYNSFGALIKSNVIAGGKKNLQLNIGDLPKGIYYINIITGKETKSFKFVKAGK